MSPVWGVAILVLCVWFLLAFLSSAIAIRKNRSANQGVPAHPAVRDRPFSPHPLPATAPSGSIPASPTPADLGPLRC